MERWALALQGEVDISAPRCCSIKRHRGLVLTRFLIKLGLAHRLSVMVTQPSPNSEAHCDSPLSNFDVPENTADDPMGQKEEPEDMHEEEIAHDIAGSSENEKAHEGGSENDSVADSSDNHSESVGDAPHADDTTEVARTTEGVAGVIALTPQPQGKRTATLADMTPERGHRVKKVPLISADGESKADGLPSLAPIP